MPSRIVYKKLAELPEWFLLLKDDSYLSAREVSELLNITTDTITKRVQAEKFPRPDRIIVNERRHRRIKCNYWSVSCLKKFFLLRE